jgi:hypothetical protein
LHQRAAGDRPERFGIGLTGDLGDVDERQVDVPQNQPVNLVPPPLDAA